MAVTSTPRPLHVPLHLLEALHPRLHLHLPRHRHHPDARPWGSGLGQPRRMGPIGLGLGAGSSLCGGLVLNTILGTRFPSVGLVPGRRYAVWSSGLWVFIMVARGDSIAVATEAFQNIRTCVRGRPSSRGVTHLLRRERAAGIGLALRNLALKSRSIGECYINHSEVELDLYTKSAVANLKV